MNSFTEKVLYELSSRGYIVIDELNDDVKKSIDDIITSIIETFNDIITSIIETLERKEKFIELLEYYGVNNHGGWNNAISELNGEDEDEDNENICPECGETMTVVVGDTSDCGYGEYYECPECGYPDD